MHPEFLSIDHDISLLSAFKTPAKARYFLEVSSVGDLPKLKTAYDFANANRLPIVYLGSGTNCLFAFDAFEGLVIKNGLKGWEIRETDAGRTLRAYSAELVSPLATMLYRDLSVSTFLPWVGLPGTVGWAVVGNAGCFGLETSQVLVEAEVFDLVKGSLERVSADDMEFHYRESVLKGGTDRFVVSATFDLDRAFPENEFMTKTPEEMQLIRRSKQPPGLSCGSYFKNPKGNSAGRLIDQAGLKGRSVGGIRISEYHGNFFINFGKAGWRDVLALAEIAKEEVKKAHGIELHEEVRIIRNEQA